MVYDRKRATEIRAVMTFEEGGETFSSYFLLPRTREDLQKRFETHRRVASWTHGLLGRSPDNFPSYVSGLVMDPAMFDRIRPGFGDNIKNYHRHMRANDIFASHTVTNPQGWRLADPNNTDKRTPPTLRVIDEDDRGVTITGKCSAPRRRSATRPGAAISSRWRLARRRNRSPAQYRLTRPV
jgi:4-hydroxyphenylacetate 3-monooxygenase